MLSDKDIIRGGVPSLYEKIRQNINAEIGGRFFRESRNLELKAQINDIRFTLISQNCIGGVFYHDLGQRFLSPTINLSFDGPDYIRFVSNLDWYLGRELVEVVTSEVPYPVGHLEDVEIRFNHYKTFAEAKQKWDERKQRIVKSNIFIIATDRDGMGQYDDNMKRFDKLPYPKLMYTAKEHPQYSWVVPMKRFKNKKQVGTLTGYCNLRGERFYEECVDLPHWLNSHGDVVRKL